MTACSLTIQPAYTDPVRPLSKGGRITDITRQEPIEVVTSTVIPETTAEPVPVFKDDTEQTTLSAIEQAETTAHEAEQTIEATTAERAIETMTETTTAYEEPTYTFGTAGRLDIPAVGVGVALYETDLYQPNVQSVVDAWDSAAIFPYRDRITVIADHNNQGFDGIKKAGIGETAFISRQDGSSYTYTCTRVCNDGHNLGTELVDEYGEQIENNADGELVMYTCNDGWRSITITYWQRTD